MKDRCTKPTSNQYKNYGARGITVCDEWLNDLGAFARDMGERPPGCTLDRVDNDGPYAPWNCRWATRSEQGNNTRRNVIFVAEGESPVSMTMAQIIRFMAVENEKRVRIRLLHGWSLGEAICVPVGVTVGRYTRDAAHKRSMAALKASK